jgi:hypothetical protein
VISKVSSLWPERYHFISDATLVEARALQNGQILVGKIGCNKIEVNLDYVQVIEVMENGENALDPAVEIYEECSNLCHNL